MSFVCGGCVAGNSGASDVVSDVLCQKGIDLLGQLSACYTDDVSASTVLSSIGRLSLGRLLREFIVFFL